MREWPPEPAWGRHVRTGFLEEMTHGPNLKEGSKLARARGEGPLQISGFLGIIGFSTHFPAKKKNGENWRPQVQNHPPLASRCTSSSSFSHPTPQILGSEEALLCLSACVYLFTQKHWEPCVHSTMSTGCPGPCIIGRSSLPSPHQPQPLEISGSLFFSRTWLQSVQPDSPLETDKAHLGQMLPWIAFLCPCHPLLCFFCWFASSSPLSSLEVPWGKCLCPYLFCIHHCGTLSRWLK